MTLSLRLGDHSLNKPVLFLNVGAATAETLYGREIDEGYRKLCTFFGCGLIDRTGILEPGFDYAGLTPMPEPYEKGEIPDFKKLCRMRAKELLSEAVEKDIRILVMWSGGIDSSTALAYLIDEAQASGHMDRLVVAYSGQSKQEHPAMFKRLKRLKVKLKRKGLTWKMTSKWTGIIVTGEGGDHLFGSAKSLAYRREALMAPWPKMLPRILETEFDVYGVKDIMDFVAPQLRAGIGEEASLFKALWWLNISCKWNTVMLRLAFMDHGDPFENAKRYRHYFESDAFQRWALSQDRNTPPPTWNTYKMDMRLALLELDQDQTYFETKLKEPSLCQIVDRRDQRRITATGKPVRRDNDGGGGYALGTPCYGFESAEVHSQAPSPTSYSIEVDGG